jgi:PAS domain S-box-containing protein
MQRTRAEVRNILDHLGSGLLTIDCDERVTRVNPAAARILALAHPEQAGRRLEELLGPTRAELTACLRTTLEDGRPRKRQEIEIAPEGRVVPLGVNVDVLDDGNGACSGVVAVFTDLTDVRRMQEHLRRADRLAGVGELAASIAHEIRNPLASIRGSVEILAGELSLGGHQDQLLQLILKESARVNRIIEDFLHFARLRPAQSREVAVERFVDEVVLQINQHVRAHAGEVDVTWSVEPPDLVLGADPEQLQQVVLNLAINACEAMHFRGALHVGVSEAAPWCICEITDTGPGLDPDLHDQIFKPFVTSKTNGTGLGLPMVARIVHGHGGTVDAVNAPGGGAVFTVRLPLDQQSRTPVGCR